MEPLELHRQFRRHLSLEEGLSHRTVKSMESSFKTFLTRTGVSKLEEIDEGCLREFFYKGREYHHWSQSHYINNHKYLKRFFQWAVDRGYRKDNPILSIKRPKLAQSLPRPLKIEDAKKILYVSYDYPWRYEFEQIRNHAIFHVLLFTGLRMNELLNLQVMDINLGEQKILVRKGKGSKDRFIPIHFKLLRTLERYLKERRTLQKLSPWVFTATKSDNPLSPKDIYRVCKKITKHSGVIFTPHQLRHTFASNCIEEGLGIVPLKEMMGHSSLASTMIYVKLSTKSLLESVNRLELF